MKRKRNGASLKNQTSMEFSHNYVTGRNDFAHGLHYLTEDWGQGPSSRGILHCFEEIGEYWLAFKNNTLDVE